MESRKNDLLENFIYVGIIVVLFLANRIIPVLGSLLTFLCPAPIAYVYVRFGFPRLLVVLLFSAVLILPAGGMGSVLLFVLFFAVLGVVLGILIEKGFSPSKVIVTTVLLMSFVSTTGIFAYSKVTETNIFQDRIKFFENEFQKSLETYKEKISEEGKKGKTVSYASGKEEDDQIRLLEKSFAQTMDIIRICFPAITVISMFLIVLANFSGLRIFLERVGDRRFVSQGGLLRLVIPDQIIWVFIVSFFLFFFGNKVGWNPLFLVACNVLLLAVVCYTIQGLGILTFYFKKWKVPIPIRVVSYFLAIMQPFVLIIIGLGVFDVWFDFRKIRIISQ